MRIGIIPHLKKPKALEATRGLLGWLQSRGVVCLLHPEVATALGRDDLSFGSEDPGKIMDAAVVLGGDGALLNAARLLIGTGLPILGVNMGHLGFLTEIRLGDLYPAMERLLSGKYGIEERMMIEARVNRKGREVGGFVGLNDAVITKGAFARMIRLKTYVDQEYIGSYPADGIIVASPTGSTAYSLSAGGPIVNPRVETLIVTLICPHTLYARSLVISADEFVRVIVVAGHEEIMLTVDGQIGFPLCNNDEVVVGRSAHRTRLVKLKGRSFYEVVRTRLTEGKF